MINLSDFLYYGVPVEPTALCVQNRLHGFNYRLGTQGKTLSLVTVNNYPPVIGRRDMSEIAVDGRPLDTWVALAQAQILKDIGIELPAGTVSKYHETLRVSYLLSSSVCVVAMQTRNGTQYALVTKCPELISALRPQLCQVDKKKRLDYFSTQFSTTYAEIHSGAFNTVRIFADVDGIRLNKVKIGAKSARHLIPYYSIQNYAAQLVALLSTHRVTLTYRDGDGVSHRFSTTLINPVLAELLDTTINGAESAKWVDWTDALSLGYMSLIDLKSRQFVSVPILNIENIEIEKG